MKGLRIKLFFYSTDVNSQLFLHVIIRKIALVVGWWLAGLSKTITNSAKVELGLGLSLATFDDYIRSTRELEAWTKNSWAWSTRNLLELSFFCSINKMFSSLAPNNLKLPLAMLQKNVRFIPTIPTFRYVWLFLFNSVITAKPNCCTHVQIFLFFHKLF